MIRIVFNEPDTRVWKQWRRDCADAKQRLDAAAPDNRTVEDIYRRRSIKQRIFFDKRGPFAGKCAYCEAYVTDFQHGEIEHFRPKMGVTDENDVPITRQGPNGKEAHPGYYWLAYEWRNLLPSCIACNQPREGGGGKRTRFPVVGEHGWSPGEERNEAPLLINPADPGDADPADHLDVNTTSDVGMMQWKSPRGETCVKVFQLNQRDQLVKGRAEAINALRMELTRALQCLTNPNQGSFRAMIEEIRSSLAGHLSFTLARRCEFDRVLNELGV